MGLTNLIGLLGLIAVPVIIILYMLRPKNKPLKIPSLYLWKQMADEIESASKIKKLKSSILMFVQIFIVLLLTMIFAGLFIIGENNTENVLIVIDASYTMGAKDVDDSRMAYAKKLANDYVRNLDDNSEVTLLVLEEVPKTIIRDEKDKGFISNLINQIEVIDGICQVELVSETIDTLREADQEVVYFGDRYFNGISNIRTLQNTNNYSVHNISYTKYLREGTITALTKIYNHDKVAALIPVSFYVDNKFFAAKQVEIEPMSSGKLFFENIPYDTTLLSVQIDGEDNLRVDDIAFKMVQVEKRQKALLVTLGNNFLEKALSLHPNVELYTSDNPNDLYGYDIYIFDGIFPENFPVDGNYLVFNPDERELFNHIGYVENPVFTTNEHQVTNHIESTEFATRVTSVFEVQDQRNIIYNTSYGPSAFEMLIQDNKAIVYGFDIHDTDLPLSIEFPILMMNTVDYLLTNQMVGEEELYVGDSVSISILPSTIKGKITSPSGIVSQLDLNRREYIYSGINEVGIYTITQEQEYDTLNEEFAVNIPYISENQGEINERDLIKTPLSTKSLGLYIGVLVLILILIEWFIYSYRRKIHEYKL